MAEFERPEHLRQGHLFDPAIVRRDLWHLLMIFMSDENIASRSDQDSDWGVGLLELHSEFCEDEITRILISSAISLRILDDRDGGVLQRVAPCGVLEVNGQSGALTFREACNKIVHAERVNFDIERLDGKPLERPQTMPSFLNPTIYLYGIRQREAWRATLDVVAYVRGAILVV